MSCTGAPGEGECGAVLRDVWLFLDDELDPQRRAAVQRHLDECSPCLEEAGLDAKLKQLLQRKCGGDQAPERLRQRVVTSLLQVRASTVEGGFAVDTVTATSVTVQWGGGPEAESEPLPDVSHGADPGGAPDRRDGR